MFIALITNVLQYIVAIIASYVLNLYYYVLNIVAQSILLFIAAPTQQQEPAPSETSPPPDDSAPTPAPRSDLRTRGRSQAGAPSGPPDPNPGYAAEAEDDATSEASSNESNPADQMAELETLTKDELLAEDFICEYLSEGYDIVVDMTEIFCRKWRSAFKPGSCIVIDETMIGW